MNDNLVCALDVGTRSVKGLVACVGEHGANVVASDVAEHATRAMKAGEVRDVRAVSALIAELIGRLSARLGSPLRRVAVAVAGRDLRTCAGRAGVDVGGAPIDEEQVSRTTYDALRNALDCYPKSSVGGGLAAHYCVGFATTRVLVDGEAFPEPVGHSAARLEVEVLATILPRRVLDGLAAALELAGLEPTAITLEPIAALQAAVPEELRRFHLALVDIGAGTSDIAVVRDGVIQSFGMVPCAGDFVTEALADIYAVDFIAAERAKRALFAGNVVSVRDVFDREVSIAPPQAIAALTPAVGVLASRIAESVRGLCDGAPRLVLCVGGASMTPGLTEALAQALGLPADRVGCRSVPSVGLAAGMSGPQAATPLGIALVAAAGRGLRLRRFQLDGRRQFAMELGRPLNVLDALISAGVSPQDIHGRLGLSTTYTLNGVVRTAPGSCGEAGRIELDGELIRLNMELPVDAALTLVPARPGVDAVVTLGAALAAAGLERRLTVMGQKVAIHPRATVNGFPGGVDGPLPDRARIVTGAWPTVREILGMIGIAPNGGFFCEGHPIGIDSVPADGANIEMVPEYAPAKAASTRMLRIMLNGRYYDLERPVSPDSPVGGPAMLVDLLPPMSSTLRQSAGRRLRMTVDGAPAGYTTPIHEGADVAIHFD